MTSKFHLWWINVNTVVCDQELQSHHPTQFLLEIKSWLTDLKIMIWCVNIRLIALSCSSSNRGHTVILVTESFVGKRRREEANFPGASVILKQIKEKPQKRRVGFISSGAPARGRPD